MAPLFKPAGSERRPERHSALRHQEIRQTRIKSRSHPGNKNEWMLFIATASGGGQEDPLGFVRKGLRAKPQFDLGLERQNERRHRGRKNVPGRIGTDAEKLKAQPADKGTGAAGGRDGAYKAIINQQPPSGCSGSQKASDRLPQGPSLSWDTKPTVLVASRALPA